MIRRYGHRRAAPGRAVAALIVAARYCFADIKDRRSVASMQRLV
jgi:hypothetical protein